MHHRSCFAFFLTFCTMSLLASSCSNSSANSPTKIDSSTTWQQKAEQASSEYKIDKTSDNAAKLLLASLNQLAASTGQGKDPEFERRL